jgi:hypothetical protein
LSNQLVSIFGGTGSTVVLQPNASVASNPLRNCEDLSFSAGGSVRFMFRGLDGVGGATTAEVRVQLVP